MMKKSDKIYKTKIQDKLNLKKLDEINLQEKIEVDKFREKISDKLILINSDENLPGIFDKKLNLPATERNFTLLQQTSTRAKKKSKVEV